MSAYLNNVEALLGKKSIFYSAEPVGQHILQRFASVTRYPRHNLSKAEKGNFLTSIPPTFVFEAGYDIGEEIDPDTGLQVGLVSWLGNPKDIARVANEYEIHRLVSPEDIIQGTREVIKVSSKEIKSQRWFFVTTEVVFRNQHGEVLGINRETVACRY